MLAVKVSSKYQVVIPKEARLQANIHVGQMLQVIPFRNRLEFIQVMDIRKSRGTLTGVDSTVIREGDRV